MRQKYANLKKLNLTVDVILKLFLDNEEDCDTNIAKEIVYRIFILDFFTILFLYGEKPLLLILKMLEENEEYEICQVILEQIEEQNIINKDAKIRTRYEE